MNKKKIKRLNVESLLCAFFFSKCDKYRKGIIDGSACSSLCDKETLYMSRCLSTLPNNQVGNKHFLLISEDFQIPKRSLCTCVGQVYTGSWGDLDGIIRCRLGEVVHYELGEEPEPRREAPVFDKPTRGTSVEKFREMVLNHLKVRRVHTWNHVF